MKFDKLTKLMSVEFETLTEAQLYLEQLGYVVHNINDMEGIKYPSVKDKHRKLKVRPIMFIDGKYYIPLTIQKRDIEQKKEGEIVI